MRRALGQSLVLGAVPRWQDSTYDQRLVTLLDPHSAPAEAYQRLGVNVRFLLATARGRDSVPRRRGPGDLLLTPATARR